MLAGEITTVENHAYKEPKVFMGVQMPKVLRDWIDEQARRQGVSRSDVVRQLVMREQSREAAETIKNGKRS